ncbi:MAG: DUF5131 family protein [Kiritimatiellae bacterium]|nr:DUF5131 family protein [Kiritimatiellia bacterium]
MAEITGVPWADMTFNGWIGCTWKSPACDFCYAEGYGHRFGVAWGAGQPRRRTSADSWRKPLAWNKAAALGRFKQCPGCGWRGFARGTICPHCDTFVSVMDSVRPRVFGDSLGDWLDDEVPIEWFVALLRIIWGTPNLDWLMVSKRIGKWTRRMAALVDQDGRRRLAHTQEFYLDEDAAK